MVSLLAAGVFGNSLGALTDGVLGKLTGQEETDSGLDLPGGEGRPPVVVGQTRGFSRNALEDVVHEGVHDRHSFAADASVRVHLLQDFVDVDGVTLPPPLPAFLVSWTLGLCLGGGLLRSFACCGFRGHVSTSAFQHDVTVAERREVYLYSRVSRLCKLSARRRSMGAGGSGNLKVAETAHFGFWL